MKVGNCPLHNLVNPDFRQRNEIGREGIVRTTHWNRPRN